MRLRKVFLVCLMPIATVMLFSAPSSADEQERQTELNKKGVEHKREEPTTVFASLIVDSLRSGDPSAIERACKALGVECAAPGFAGVRVILPCCSEKLRPLTLIGISFEDPVDGYLLLISDSGKVIDKKRVGYIKALGARSLLSGDEDAVVVDSKVGAGTGFAESRFTVFGLSEKGFEELWQGASRVSSFPLLAEPAENYELSGLLGFEDADGDGVFEILYTNIKKKYSYDKKREKLLPGDIEEVTVIYKLIDGKYEPMPRR
ncbi:MAG: hypothetical protein GWN86_30090 [Desulfobacterales bacterium]|nr:hypothetical protein [Desulfobacterales bacterium]